MNAKLVAHLKVLITLYGRGDILDALDGIESGSDGWETTASVRGRKRINPPEGIAKIIEKNGIAGTSRLIGVSQSVVSRWSRSLGIGTARKGKPSASRPPDEIDKVLELYSDHRIAGIFGVPHDWVSGWRKERGIARIADSTQQAGCPPWLDRIRDRLGKEEDSVLAREVGVVRERVRQVRERLGVSLDRDEIRRSRAYRQMDSINPKIRDIIGTMSDYDVVRECGGGFSHAAVQRWRGVLGIPAVGKPFVARRGKSALNEFAHMFGEYTDAEIARASGLTAHGVRFYRERHGIPIFSRRKKVVAPDAGS